MTNSTIDIAVIKDYFLGLQNRITTAISALDGKAFMVDEWQKPPESKLRGSGRTCILENGNVLEKGGVGFSHVHGDQMPGAASQNRPEVAGRGFEAMGVSWSLGLRGARWGHCRKVCTDVSRGARLHRLRCLRDRSWYAGKSIAISSWGGVCRWQGSCSGHQGW